MRFSLLLPLAFLAISACSAPPVRYDVPIVEVTERQRIRYASVEVMDVSLPRYAAEEAILMRDETGALVENSSVVWADDPARSVTLELVRHIGTMTGAKTASDPWPFREPAGVRVEVRVEGLSAQPGVLRMSGQYFVAADSGVGDHSHRFTLSEPWVAEGGMPELAAARARIVAQLAQEIVNDGLR